MYVKTSLLLPLLLIKSSCASSENIILQLLRGKSTTTDNNKSNAPAQRKLATECTPNEPTAPCYMISYDADCVCKAADKKTFDEYMAKVDKEGLEDPKPGCEETCAQLGAMPICDPGEKKCYLLLHENEITKEEKLIPTTTTTTTTTKFMTGCETTDECYTISDDAHCKCLAADEKKYTEYNDKVAKDGGTKPAKPGCEGTCDQLEAEPFCDPGEMKCYILLNGNEITQEEEFKPPTLMTKCDSTDQCNMISDDAHCKCLAADEKKYSEYMDKIMKDGLEPAKPGCEDTCAQLNAYQHCDVDEEKCALLIDETMVVKEMELKPTEEKTTKEETSKECKEDKDCVMIRYLCGGCDCIAIHRDLQDDMENEECTKEICENDPCWDGAVGGPKTAKCVEGACYEA